MREKKLPVGRFLDLDYHYLEGTLANYMLCFPLSPLVNCLLFISTVGLHFVEFMQCIQYIYI